MADGVREYLLTLQGTAYYHFPTFNPIAATALALILDKPHALPKNRVLKDFLKMYDVCLFKFEEMERAAGKP